MFAGDYDPLTTVNADNISDLDKRNRLEKRYRRRRLLNPGHYGYRFHELSISRLFFCMNSATRYYSPTNLRAPFKRYSYIIIMPTTNVHVNAIAVRNN